MNSSSSLRFLRPYLHGESAVSTRSAWIRFFNTTRCLQSEESRPQAKHKDKQTFRTESSSSFQVQERTRELRRTGALEWPRIMNDAQVVTLRDLTSKLIDIEAAEAMKDDVFTVRGRVRRIRSLGKSLLFVDIEQDRYYVQLILNVSKMSSFGNVTPKQFNQQIRRGDIITCTGNPYITKQNQPAIIALEIPELLSPCLDTLPLVITDQEMRIRSRHVDFLVTAEVSNTIRARSAIIQNVRDFLLKDHFMEVQTPILADKASGAVAKPFATRATEFPEKQLALRIAPELWLKRLIVGGMDRIFEIGPAFRNEGLDATHNPEFTTCEFYKSFADLEELIKMTEDMFAGLAELISELQVWPLKSLPPPDVQMFTSPFKRISFIPAIEEGLKQQLPDLQSDSAEEDLIAIFQARELPLPSSPTLPRLLDRLCSIYIEPQCEGPTFITYHPACMAPLAKSFLDLETNQYVSARAEFFIQKREIANMYEEENSPIEQRKKFIEQIKWKDEENEAQVDESYLEALEWGMPPTGGWGMGIDRLVMLFTGSKRISDVLTFGNLRNVVNLGTIGTEKLKAIEANAEKEQV